MSNEGKKCVVHYVGTLDDGSVFDSSRERDKPIEFVCGQGKMIPGFDRAVASMTPGETRTIHLEPADAYGMPDPSNVLRVDTGETLYFYNADNKPVSMTIKYAQHGRARWAGTKDPGYTIDTAVGETHKIIARKRGKAELRVAAAKNGKVDFDLNHHLAGKALNFTIELLEVKD